MTNLGKIKRSSITKEWNSEPLFSKWLASENNLNYFIHALGIEDGDIILKGTEFRIGSYYADIVAQSTKSQQYVIIENQYGKTDHAHIGKLLTYSSNLSAGTIIWIAESFTEEHKQTLDWLNENTGEDLSFFGVTAELLQIDNSLPAINYDIVCRPNYLIKQAKKPRSETQDRQYEFWKAVTEILRQKTGENFQTPKGENKFDVTLGENGTYLHNTISIKKKCCRVQLRTDSREILNKLEQEKVYIEKQLGPLKWDFNPNRIQQLIYIEKQAKLTNDKIWHEHVKWMADNILKFRDTFKPLF